jgi:carboxyl-terminal processing protease
MALRARTVCGCLLTGILLLAVDVASATDQATEAAVRVFAQALGIIQSQYVEVRTAPAFEITETRPLMVFVMKGLERRLAPRGVSVDVGADALTITHRAPEAPAETLTLPSVDLATGPDAVRAVARVITFLQGRAGLGVESITDVLVSSLVDADPQGIYIDRHSYRELRTQKPDNSATIGLEVTFRDRTLSVLAAVDGTPAFRAGLQAGDRILAIDRLSTSDMSFPEIWSRLRGKPGSRVTLSVLRDDRTGPTAVEITREEIRVRSVESRELGNGIGYVKIRLFQEDTPREVSGALERLSNGGVQGLILDIRNNPGGLLTAVVEVAEKFLTNGRLVVFTEGRERKSNLRLSAHAMKPYTMVSMVVLVNRASAAGAEIVAGALQDWGRATLVGQQTPGLAVLRTTIALTDGSAVRLTTAQWFTPKGQSVQGKGLRPDLVVEAPRDTKLSGRSNDLLTEDRQLESAVTYLRSMIKDR